MKLLLVAVGLLALSSAVPTSNKQTYSKELLQRQKDILGLFRYVNQPSYYKDHVEIASTFDLYKRKSDFTNAEVFEEFYTLYKYHHILPRGEIFSIFYQEHLDQAIALFKLFYYAKDYQTFYETAVWARSNVNEGLFLYTVSVAVVHRPDTYGIVLPPIYEVYPYYFYSSEVIQKAQKYKQVYENQETYTINANYSGYYHNLNPEQSLSYYLEDVGINSFYYYYNLYYPFWLGGEDFKFATQHRGEQFYYVYQQLLARYYLERLSNGFGNIESFNWELPFENGYVPSLRYPNGLEFPSRPNYANLYEYFYNYGQRNNFRNRYSHAYTYVQDYERRIRDAIDRGYIYVDGKKFDFRTPEGVNYLGNLIESNYDSPDRDYYGALNTYARHLLGYSYQPYDYTKIAPSALEHFETSLRDPAFYQYYKRIIYYFQNNKAYLPRYNESQLYFNGVQIENVEFDRLITYFDYFYSDLSQAVYVTPEEFVKEGQFNVRSRQQRLNHKPFTYRIKVTSEKEQDAVVRVYLGPKYDEYGRAINVSQNRLNFVHFDHFKYRLTTGQNTINRNSRQNYFYRPDRTSYYQLYQKVLGALDGNGEFDITPYEHVYGFPLRYLLPKGSYNGFEYQFYVIVSPYVPYELEYEVDYSKYQFEYPGSNYIDGYPYGFPFDRPIDCEQFFNEAPNSYFYTTKIYHRSEEDINASTTGRAQQ